MSTQNKKAIALYTEADNYRVRRQFNEAESLLVDAIKKDDQFIEAYLRLGLVYKAQKLYNQALTTFDKGCSLTNDPKKSKAFWFEIGECFFLMGEYQKAELPLQQFKQNEIATISNKQKIESAQRMLNSVTFYNDQKQKTQGYKTEPLSDTVNQFPLQYFPVLTADGSQLIFTRRKGNQDTDDEDIMICDWQNIRWSVPKSISPNINSKLNEGTCTVTADGRTIIFTSCVGRQGWGSCDLYESVKKGEEWSLPRNLGQRVNSPDWESQPALSADGRVLFFVSDRRGGLGRRDIWYSTKLSNGEWSKAKNLGKEINTVYDEISPFIHVNGNTFFFATNGLPGLGGYDIFKTEKDANGNWQKPVNLGMPINNHEDQYALFVAADGVTTYYAHEETDVEGKSVSLLYKTILPMEAVLASKPLIAKGYVRDAATNKPLKSTIELISVENDSLVSLVYSDSLKGNYVSILPEKKEYALIARCPGYMLKSIRLSIEEVQNLEVRKFNFELEKIERGKTAVLNNIFFDFNSAILKNESKSELEKVIIWLEENPLVKIEIRGHTDNIGSPEYNLELSFKRAEAVKIYLINRQIPEYRLVSKGYGLTQPIAPNNSESGQKSNRRIEFRIL
ncbi:MAG: OmpA family protein [Cytophagales bacterium]|nr:OmpA family protein [Cytophagales bacterium]